MSPDYSRLTPAYYRRHVELWRAFGAAIRAVPLGECPAYDPAVIRSQNALEAHDGKTWTPDELKHGAGGKL